MVFLNLNSNSISNLSPSKIFFFKNVVFVTDKYWKDTNSTWAAIGGPSSCWAAARGVSALSWAAAEGPSSSWAMARGGPASSQEEEDQLHLQLCLGLQQQQEEGQLSLGQKEEGHLCLGLQQESHLCLGKQQEGHLHLGKQQEGYLHLGQYQEGHFHLWQQQEGHLHLGEQQEDHLCLRQQQQEGHLCLGQQEEGHLWAAVAGGLASSWAAAGGPSCLGGVRRKWIRIILGGGRRKRTDHLHVGQEEEEHHLG